ncbi:hypothetical protein [Devosia sp. 2618]|uniref:hypothetical protein n=1 Tax=Devosia sp. 2618 TaxID=3156454 RepID=UPI0033917411
MNIPDPQSFTDPDKLRKLMANAVRLGYDDLAFGCQIRIATLAGNAFKEPVERAFITGLVAAEEFRTADNGRSTKLTSVRAKYKRLGAVRVLSDQMMAEDFTDGFDKLVAHNRADLTGEAIVMNNEDDFTVDVVNAARKKLMERGVTIGDTEVAADA